METYIVVFIAKNGGIVTFPYRGRRRFEKRIQQLERDFETIARRRTDEACLDEDEGHVVEVAVIVPK